MGWNIAEAARFRRSRTLELERRVVEEVLSDSKVSVVDEGQIYCPGEETREDLYPLC